MSKGQKSHDRITSERSNELLDSKYVRIKPSKAKYKQNPVPKGSLKCIDYIELNGGKPCFNEWDLANIEGEHYSDLDYATGRNWLKK